MHPTFLESQKLLPLIKKRFSLMSLKYRLIAGFEIPGVGIPGADADNLAIYRAVVLFINCG
jgi:hypothetical protein